MGYICTLNSALISGAIFVENIVLANIKLHIFSALFHKSNYFKRMNNFYKIKEIKCHMHVHIKLFHVHQESHMHHIRHSWVFWLSFKMKKMCPGTYGYITLTRRFMHVMEHPVKMLWSQHLELHTLHSVIYLVLILALSVRL